MCLAGEYPDRIAGPEGTVLSSPIVGRAIGSGAFRYRSDRIAANGACGAFINLCPDY